LDAKANLAGEEKLANRLRSSSAGGCSDGAKKYQAGHERIGNVSVARAMPAETPPQKPTRGVCGEAPITSS
jgi:hypothetical protein